MHQLYYLKKASSYFSSMDGTFYIKVDKAGRDYYIPFLTLRNEIINKNEPFLDDSCILSKSKIPHRLFLKHIENFSPINQALLRKGELTFDTQNESIRMSIGIGDPPILVTSIENAIDDMLRIYLDSGLFFRMPRNVVDYQKEQLCTFYREQLRPYFPGLCVGTSPSGPRLFL